MIDHGMLEEWIRQWGYLAVFVPLLLETAGIPLPGMTILIIAAAASSRGLLNPFVLAGVAALGAILGDNIGYCIGRYGGRKLVNRIAHIGHIESSLARGEQFFLVHGGKAVFLARWVGGLRIFGAWIAGMSHMPWRTFFVWNVAGGVTWAATITAIGYAFGNSIQTIERVLGTFGAIGFALVVIIAASLLIRKLHRRQRARADALISHERSNQHDN